MWTKFSNTNGNDSIIIEADDKEDAMIVFSNRFGDDDYVSNSDYEIETLDTLEDATIIIHTDEIGYIELDGYVPEVDIHGLLNLSEQV